MPTAFGHRGTLARFLLFLIEVFLPRHSKEKDHKATALVIITSANQSMQNQHVWMLRESFLQQERSGNEGMCWPFNCFKN